MTMRWKFFISILVFGFFSEAIWADEAALRKAIQPHFADSKIESVKKTNYLGLYEVVVGDEVFYTDAKADYFFFGHVIDTKTRMSMTNERIQEIKAARRVPLDSLPLQSAIKIVKGDGKRRVAIFTDPNCPYCKQLEKELLNVTNVTIYTLLYPVLKGSMELSKKIWCSDNQIKAWDDFMLKDVAPSSKDCETPLDALVKSGRENKVNGTPTLIFADGSVVGGMIPATAIEEKLESASKSK
ncbi:MAG: DsbC family protein [Nitrosomonas sp.]|jgi:thiol:disulfide interchange protein DsbC|uniref:DsbC family protein n=1 Tax=Nitrosomonas sp. TaxID=42353 RepID=UPI0027222C5A|nr:DsbC family protein [Nitrosomonas sp.]MDO8894053.1 DsbC family protein [Nitrosomonas sp.]MDP1551284.1 DsbC family protein [Nitrosomonas sp.]MDP1788441.1 DsbC family protein [Nitrosomonas sp.]MDP1935064.1 DsbC family protein [Nitrosomonas sp.]MDP2223437.1 DsbC family protein [Nitrosomonas sp.]